MNATAPQQSRGPITRLTLMEITVNLVVLHTMIWLFFGPFLDGHMLQAACTICLVGFWSIAILIGVICLKWPGPTWFERLFLETGWLVILVVGMLVLVSSWHNEREIRWFIFRRFGPLTTALALVPTLSTFCKEARKSLSSKAEPSKGPLERT